jgi:cyanate permease
MSIHCIPFLTDMGIDELEAAGMMSIWIAASIPARFIGGVIADRIKSRNLRLITSSSYLLQAVGVFIFLQYQTIPSIIIWFILYGIGQGGGMAANPIIRARFFGRKSFGSIAGFARLFMTPVGILGPIYAGWIYDTTGSYHTAFVQLAIMLSISTVLAFFIFPPRPPATTTDIGSTT